MAVPNLNQGYYSLQAQLKAQREEADKARKAQQDAALTQFGMDIGKVLLSGAVNAGTNALDTYQKDPLERAKIGAYDAPLYSPEVQGGAANAGTSLFNSRAAALDALKSKVSGAPRPATYEMDATERAATKAGELPPVTAPGQYVPSKTLPKPPTSAGEAPTDRASFRDGTLPVVDPAELGTDPTRRLDRGDPSKGPSLAPEPPPPVQWQDRKPEDYKPGAVEVRTKPPGPGGDKPPQPLATANMPIPPGEGMFQGPVDVLPGDTAELPTGDAPFVPAVERADAPPVIDFQKIARSRAGLVEPSLTADMLNSLGQSTNQKYDLSNLSDRERGLFNASQSILAERNANAAHLRSLATPMVKGETPLQAANRMKVLAETDAINRKADAAKQRAVEGTPEYEASRMAAWSEAGKLSKSVEKRVSSSGGRGIGTSGGAVVINVGGGSSNSPSFKALVVSDERGWPRVVVPDVKDRFLFKNPDGSFEQYYPDKGSVHWAKDANGKYNSTPSADVIPQGNEKLDGKNTSGGKNKRLNSTGKPAPRPAVLEPVQPPKPPLAAARPAQPAVGAKPINEITNLVELEARKSKILAASDAVIVAGVPKSQQPTAQQAADLAAIKRQEDTIRANDAAADKQGKNQLNYLNEIPTLAESYRAALDAAVKPLIPDNGISDNNGGALTVDELRAAARGEPPPSDMEDDDAALYAKKAADLAAARKAATKAWMSQNLPHLRELYRAQGGTDGQFYQDVETRFNFKLPAGERPKASLVPPGPAETSPGQPPPPGQSSQAEDLFHRVNAQPWSAAKKRRVFLATAQRDGIA